MSCCSTQLDSQSGPVRSGFRIDPDLVCLVLAGLIAGNSTLVALVANLSEIDANTRRWFHWGLLVATVVVAGLLLPQMGRGIRVNWKRRSLSVDLLFLLGCVGAWSYSLTSMIAGHGPVYFEVVSILMVIYSLGTWIKGETQRRVWRQLDAWSPREHLCQVIGDDGQLRWNRVDAVQPGWRIQVPIGAMVPVDGEVVDGSAFVREAGITGEPHLRAVYPGDRVLATAVVIDAMLQFRALAPGNQRMIDGVIQTVERARQSPSRWETQADRVARWFTPTVASVALLTGLIWYGCGSGQQAWLSALAVLLVACPCAFGFATPVSIWVTVSRLAASSLIVQRNDAIERLATVDTVVFDKTGTLSIVEPELVSLSVDPASGWSREEVLQLARSLEAGSQHPIASAFLDGATGMLWPVTRLELLPAVGVRGRVMAGATPCQVEIRRCNDSGQTGVQRPSWAPPSSAEDSGQHRIQILVDDKSVGIAVIGEALLDTLDSGLQKLALLGLDVKLMSGDSGHRVDRIGITDAQGGLSPQDKADRIRDLESQGRRVLMVGDGTNDAAAMALATASISVAGGSSMASAVSDVAWQGNDLRRIADAVAITRRSISRLRRTLWFAIGYNSLGMVVAALGWLHPILAVVLMMGSSLTVVLHASDFNWEDETERLLLSPDRKMEPGPPDRESPRVLVQLR